ncbi:unnamed protein product [Prunus armeniaca]|uniref:Uncharacterized protein n=1 Tax=Prunus armeniaca TaxID=36596 RepID=A0A6J5X2H7_PRUAR|nr:unnamed protein product [Prunus armeniaca]
MREATFCMYMQILMANFNSKSPILHHLQANQEVQHFKLKHTLLSTVPTQQADAMLTPNCNSPGSACYDPRFIGGDGIVFYFHGKNNQQFSLVSDRNLQINGRFRPQASGSNPRLHLDSSPGNAFQLSQFLCRSHQSGYLGQPN